MENVFTVRQEEEGPLEELHNLALTVTTEDQFLHRETLIRLLRAREYKVPAAFEMWNKWYNWRITYRADSITEEEMMPHIVTGKAFFHGEDNNGRPLLVVRARNHWPKQFPIEETMRYVIYLVELGCKIADEKGVGQIAVLYDRGGMTSENKDPNLINMMKTLAGMLQDFYAERLAAVYVLHVNWLYWLIFQAVKPLINKKTREKVHILMDQKGLVSHFPPSQLMIEYGGEDAYVHPYST